MRYILMLAGGLLVVALFSCAASNSHAPETPTLWDQTRMQVALQFADGHIATGKFDRARAMLAAYEDSDHGRLQLTLARIDLEEGQYAAADQRLEGIPVEQRDSLAYYEATAVACEGLGRWREAALAYERTYQCEPTAARLVAWLDALVLDERAAEARETLKVERARFPGQPAVQDLAARLYTHLGDANASIRELTSTLLQDPQSIVLRQRLANAYMSAGRHAEAIPLWRELAAAVQNVRQRRSFDEKLAICLLAVGDYAEAARVYRVMTLIRSDDLPAYVGLATATLAAGLPAEAVAAAQHAVHLNPHHADARLALACGYAALAQYGKAVEVLSDLPAGTAADALVRKLMAHWRSKLTLRVE